MLSTWRTRTSAEGNARLTGLTAAVLMVILAAEGITLLSVYRLVTPHVFIGMLVVPPVAVKIGSTGWRFARYYAGHNAYRKKGPPALVLRMLAPLVVLLTVVMLGSGIALLFVPTLLRSQWLFVHKCPSPRFWAGSRDHCNNSVCQPLLAKLIEEDQYDEDVPGVGVRSSPVIRK